MIKHVLRPSDTARFLTRWLDLFKKGFTA